MISKYLLNFDLPVQNNTGHCTILECLSHLIRISRISLILVLFSFCKDRKSMSILPQSHRNVGANCQNIAKGNPVKIASQESESAVFFDDAENPTLRSPLSDSWCSSKVDGLIRNSTWHGCIGCRSTSKCFFVVLRDY